MSIGVSFDEYGNVLDTFYTNSNLHTQGVTNHFAPVIFTGPKGSATYQHNYAIITPDNELAHKTNKMTERMLFTACAVFLFFLFYR